MLAQALEIYTEIKSGQERNTENAKRVNYILKKLANSNLGDEDRNWIKILLLQRGSLSFKEKMRIIYSRFEELLPKLAHVIGTQDEFSSIMTSYRNKLTHGNIDYNKMDNEDLFWKYKDIQLILQLSILTEIGCSMEDLKSIYLIDIN